jgi:rhodanese-related sulfurtransferase
MDGEVDPDEVAALLASDDPPRVVDVRSPDAFARGHIPGSENVPFDRLPDRASSFAGAERVVTVCPHGEASVQAARLVGAAAGVDGRVESMRGGLAAWDGDLVEGDERDDRPDAPF